MKTFVSVILYMYYRCKPILDSRSSILGAKGGGVLIRWGVHIVAFLNLFSQIFVDGAGLVADFDLPEPRHPKEEVLIVDEALIFWQAFVVVPHLPVHAIYERTFCELETQRSQHFDTRDTTRGRFPCLPV